MQRVVHIDGQYYFVYETYPRYEVPKELKVEARIRREKKDHFKKMAKFNYKKK